MDHTIFARFAARAKPSPALMFLTAFMLPFGISGCGRPADQADASDNSVASQPGILGRVIHFNGSHEAEPYKVSGWSETEKDFTWSVGKAAVIALPLPPNSGAVRLRMSVAAYVHPPELNSQPVEVYANGEKVADWDVAMPVDNTADIPKEIAGKSTTLTMQLRTPKAASPAEFSAKGDERILGICCNELELTKLSAP
jgi:hypothetical protein